MKKDTIMNMKDLRWNKRSLLEVARELTHPINLTPNLSNLLIRDSLELSDIRKEDSMKKRPM